MEYGDIQKLHAAGFITGEQRQKIIAHFQLKEDSGNNRGQRTRQLDLLRRR